MEAHGEIENEHVLNKICLQFLPDIWWFFKVFEKSSNLHFEKSSNMTKKNWEGNEEKPNSWVCSMYTVYIPENPISDTQY